MPIETFRVSYLRLQPDFVHGFAFHMLHNAYTLGATLCNIASNSQALHVDLTFSGSLKYDTG